MIRRQVGRAGALAAAAALLFSGTALADTVAADGDVITAGIQGSVDLGTVAPGGQLSFDVGLTLVCDNLQHVDPGQILTVAQTGATVPAAGGSITATSATFGTVPAGWANDTNGIDGCSSSMSIESLAPSHVVLLAPSTVGLDYSFVINYGWSLTPAGVEDAASITGFTSVAFTVDVLDVPVDTTPPSLVGLPADLDVAANDPGGAVVNYTDPTATDDTDPAPTVACDPPAGALFAFGTTTVTCTATDASGNEASESFTVTVHQPGVVTWEDPIHSDGLVATRGRTVPVKARAWLNGVAIDGEASLAVSSCQPSATSVMMTVAATRQAGAGRWMTVLDTSSLAPDCYRVDLVVGGQSLGSFQLLVVSPPNGLDPSIRGGNRPH